MYNYFLNLLLLFFLFHNTRERGVRKWERNQNTKRPNSTERNTKIDHTRMCACMKRPDLLPKLVQQ